MSNNLEADYSNYVVYGPDANCTLALCPPELSVYQYRPSLAANVCFLLFFAIAGLIHLVIGLKWRSWFFVVCMSCGCICEIVGYGGRLWLWQNPFSFQGFLMQIICITFAPTWFTAAIYITLSKIIVYLGPQYARFPPKFYYWFFIPCDVLSLVLQAVGGALSSVSEGGSDAAVNVSIAGLSFQVVVIVVFIALTGEYVWRYRKGQRLTPRTTPLSKGFKIFSYFMAISITFILIRCCYRIDELSEGYSGDLIHNEGLFIALEGVMVLVAAYTLIVAHPGPVFAGLDEDQKVQDIQTPHDPEK
ncbi:MAG: hypothetical protein L6R36_008653 [Xanthoria steineri]|nr:MAG: hypothetical protein L6R36_008653 [Xanthoria steineri]